MPYLIMGEPCFERYAHDVAAHGFTAVALPCDERLNSVVASHADTLIFSDGYTHIINEELARPLSYAVRAKLRPVADTPYGSYPTDTAFNALTIRRHLYARLQSLALSVREAAEADGYTLVNVPQGYARCSTLALNNANAAVTADEGMAKAMESKGVRVLRIPPGNIKLEGCEYGFIGGASFVYEPMMCCTARVQLPTVYFFGNLTAHPDGERIREFIEGFGYDVVCFDGVLTDFGGAVII